MKLLFDHNLSPRLIERIKDIYPNASHVSLLSMDQASDEAIWLYAKTNEYIIVTKDSDFNDLSILIGFPPKVIWIQIGNCTTSDIEILLRNYYEVIVEFESDYNSGILLLE
jgi:predicted nuclease of predicted toxin-antitoxin system